MARHRGAHRPSPGPDPALPERRTRTRATFVGAALLVVGMPLSGSVAAAPLTAAERARTAPSDPGRAVATHHGGRAPHDRSGPRTHPRHHRDRPTSRDLDRPRPKPSSAPTPTPAAPRPTPTKPSSTPRPTTTTASRPGSWPDAGTTGPRAGHRLKASGSVKVTKAGTVLQDLDIDGCVTIAAPRVVLRDVRIRCGGTYGIDVESGSVTAEYVELDGLGSVHVAVVGSGYTLSHVDIHDVEDGPRLGSNVTIEDSFVHDLFRAPGSHNDAMQTTGGSNITIRHNRIVPFTDGDPMNAAIMIGSEFAPLRDMLIEGNYLDGGNYSILARDDLDGRNVVVRNNVFTKNFRFGPYRGAPGMSADASNVFVGTSTPAV